MYIILSLSSSLFTFASVCLSRAILLTLHNSICRCTYIFCHVLHHMIEFSLNLCALRNTSFTQSNIHETFVFLFCSNLLLVITVYRDNSILHASKCLNDCMKNTRHKETHQSNPHLCVQSKYYIILQKLSAVAIIYRPLNQ